ncbi:MAG: hypothetical protein M3Y07_01475, partial [Acidobacteriota bacterium]|nr:hypothetical protein [Acidobacteriota bacterium]
VAALVYRKVPYLLEVIGVLFASVGMALMTLEGNALKPGGTAAVARQSAQFPLRGCVCHPHRINWVLHGHVPI